VAGLALVVIQEFQDGLALAVIQVHLASADTRASVAGLVHQVIQEHQVGPVHLASVDTQASVDFRASVDTQE